MLRLKDLRAQVADVVRGGEDARRDPVAHVDSQGAQLAGLVGVVGQQVQLADAQGPEHLGRRRVVAGVLRQPQGGVRLVGVEALVLEGVRVELVVEADAPALLAEVEEHAAAVGYALDRLAQLRTAVAASRTEHVPGQALGVQPHQRNRAGLAQDDGHVLQAVGEAVEGDEFGVGPVAVVEAQRDPDAGARGGDDGGGVGHAGPPGSVPVRLHSRTASDLKQFHGPGHYSCFKFEAM